MKNPNERLISAPRDDARTEIEDHLQADDASTSDDALPSQLPSQHDERRPARGYSWPPFEPGHTLSLRHGATSPRAIAERAQAVHAELLDHAPYLAETKFLPAVSRYLQAAAREALLHAHIEAVSADKGPGAVPARVWEQATAAARLAARLGSDLGLDPLGHARIRALSAGADVSEASLSDLAAEGRRIRERAAARQDVALAPVVELPCTDEREGDLDG